MSLVRRTYKKLTWIDCERPTRDEITSLMEEYNIDPLVAEELLSPTRKPRIERYAQHLFLILHFPALRHTHRYEQTLQEIDFVIGNTFLITVRYDAVDAIEKFAQVFETNVILEQSPIGDTAGYLFYFLIKKLYHSLEHELEYIDSGLEGVEGRIFAGKERAMVAELSLVGRDLADISKAVGYHEEVLASLERFGVVFFGEPYRDYMKHIMSEYHRIKHQLSASKNFFDELRETNNSLLSTKQNEVMQTFTVMAFITLPLSLVASVFGMNVDHTPIAGHQFDFWIVVLLMAILSLVMFSLFKYRKWL